MSGAKTIVGSAGIRLKSEKKGLTKTVVVVGIGIFLTLYLLAAVWNVVHGSPSIPTSFSKALLSYFQLLFIMMVVWTGLVLLPIFYSLNIGFEKKSPTEMEKREKNDRNTD